MARAGEYPAGPWPGRVDGGIAAPRPSQSRTCGTTASGSSHVRFAQVAMIERTTLAFGKG